jgi:heptosyltransferase-2
MTTPALARLHERFPNAQITLLTPEKLADLWVGQPAVDSVLPFGPHESVWRIARRLRHAQFQIALVLPNSPRSALEAFLARIPSRVGYARPWRNWFLTQAVPHRPQRMAMHKRSPSEIRRLVSSASATSTLSRAVDEKLGPAASRRKPAPTAHHVVEYLHLTAALGANPELVLPRLVLSPQEVAAVARKFSLDAPGEERRPLFGLNPGAEYGPAKRWPAARFIAVAQAIQQQAQCRWLIVGGQGDTLLAKEIATAIDRYSPPPINLAGQTSLRELCAVLKLCRVFLTNDTGPMHVAAALGVPVVALFGSTSPELTGPVLAGDAPHRVMTSDAPCAPCFRRICPIDFRCMTGITIERVVQAVRQAQPR